MASRIYKTPTHVILFRVTARDTTKLVHTIQLIDIGNPAAARDPKEADKALVAQETHVIRLPTSADPSTPQSHAPTCIHVLKLQTPPVRPRFNAAESSTGSPKAYVPSVSTTRYHEILDAVPRKIWAFADHPRVFDTMLVTYKISYRGVDVYLSPSVVQGHDGRKNYKQMEANTRNYEDLHRPEHEKPRFRYADNRLDLAGLPLPSTTTTVAEEEKQKGNTNTNISSSPYELFKGKVIYAEGDLYDDAGGLEKWEDQENVGWSGWRILLKEGQKIPDWYEEEFLPNNADDVLIWQALEVSRRSKKWVGLDNRL